MAGSDIITKWELFRSFINYSLFPSPSQLDGHPHQFSKDILLILTDFLFYGFILIIYYNHILNQQFYTIIPFICLVFHCILVFISHIIILRDSITQDLVWFLNLGPKNVYRQYLSTFISVREYKAYRRYYMYNQNEIDFCGICYEEYNKDPTASQILLSCGHRYHNECLMPHEDMLIQSGKKRFCPYCRAEYTRKTMRFEFNPNYYQETNWYYSFPKILYKIERWYDFVSHYTWRFIKFMAKIWKFFVFMFICN